MLTEKELAIFKNVSKYANKHRWMSYMYQFKEVLNEEYETILIIGVGDGVVPLLIQYCIKQQNLKTQIITFDKEKDLNPDIVGDIRDIKQLTQQYKIDCILCCEVLEHIEFEYVEQILKDMSEVTKIAIISLPHSKRSLFKLSLKIPRIKEINIDLMIPKKFRPNKYHHWELGSWGKCVSIKKIESIITKSFYVIRKYNVPEIKYHLFYVLRSMK